MGQRTSEIHINQVGYPFGVPIVAFVNGQGGGFRVVNASHEVLYTGELTGPIADEASGDNVYHAVMDGLPEGGPYTLEVDGLGHSHPFQVGHGVYRDLRDALLKFLYFQRCGTELTPEYAGPWSHGACHLDEGTVYNEPSLRLPSHGGWHDAGDHGKYIVPAAKTIADLLLAFELFPTAFQSTLHIPESGNGVPDVLNEVRYELDWFFRMQRSDGAVYHKLTTRTFPSLSTMPDADKGELVFCPVSFTATATLAASMAMAARVYAPFDAAFASQCLASAELAWHWLTTEGEAVSFRNPPGILTGEYGDPFVMDEKFWAAAELYRTTQKVHYHDAVMKLLNTEPELSFTELGWADVSGYGTVAYLLTDPQRCDASARERLLATWLEEANRLKGVAHQDGYQVTLLPKDYIWGSTMVLLNHAMLLILADRLAGANTYSRIASQNFDYLLGSNPLDQCYVSHFGANPLLHPHHRPSVGDDVLLPVPGMVSGGPNRNLQDDIAKKMLAGQPPARCFIDHDDSYSTNEVTIYWNSPAVFVAAYLTQG